VALTVRVLAATDERLTAAVELTGQSPQYIVDAALAAYFDALARLIYWSAGHRYELKILPYAGDTARGATRGATRPWHDLAVGKIVD
jgi:hypothetical protein